MKEREDAAIFSSRGEKCVFEGIKYVASIFALRRKGQLVMGHSFQVWSLWEQIKTVITIWLVYFDFFKYKRLISYFEYILNLFSNTTSKEKLSQNQDLTFFSFLGC